MIGAGVRHADIEDGRVPDILDGLLARVARGIAYRAVRNRGTIGGSLAHADPAADWPGVMIALGAVIQVRSVRGARTIAAPDLFTGVLTTSLEPDELIEAVRIPRFDRAARAGFHKICLKPGDFAEALAIVVSDPARNEVRAVLSGHDQPPMLMPATARAVSAAGGRGDGSSAIKQAVQEDVRINGLAGALSPYEAALHQASMVRAAREVWRS